MCGGRSRSGAVAGQSPAVEAVARGRGRAALRARRAFIFGSRLVFRGRCITPVIRSLGAPRNAKPTFHGRSDRSAVSLALARMIASATGASFCRLVGLDPQVSDFDAPPVT